MGLLRQPDDGGDTVPERREDPVPDRRRAPVPDKMEDPGPIIMEDPAPTWKKITPEERRAAAERNRKNKITNTRRSVLDTHLDIHRLESQLKNPRLKGEQREKLQRHLDAERSNLSRFQKYLGEQGSGIDAALFQEEIDRLDKSLNGRYIAPHVRQELQGKRDIYQSVLDGMGGAEEPARDFSAVGEAAAQDVDSPSKPKTASSWFGSGQDRQFPVAGDTVPERREDPVPGKADRFSEVGEAAYADESPSVDQPIDQDPAHRRQLQEELKAAFESHYEEGRPDQFNLSAIDHPDITDPNYSKLHGLILPDIPTGRADLQRQRERFDQLHLEQKQAIEDALGRPVEDVVIAFHKEVFRNNKQQEDITAEYRAGRLDRDTAFKMQAVLQNKLLKLQEAYRFNRVPINNMKRHVQENMMAEGGPDSQASGARQEVVPVQDPMSVLKRAIAMKEGRDPDPPSQHDLWLQQAAEQGLGLKDVPAPPKPQSMDEFIEDWEAGQVTPSPGTPGVTPSPGNPGFAPSPGNPGIVAPPPERDDDPLPEPPVDEEPVEEGEPVPISQNILDIMPQGIEKTGMIEVDPGISREMITARGINPQLLVNQAVAQARQQAGPTQRNLLGGAGRGMSSDVGTFSRHALGPLAQSLLGGRQSMLRIPWEQQLKYADDVRKREQLAHDLGLKQAMLTGKDWYRRYQEQLDEQRLRNQILMGILNPLIGNLYS